MHPTRQAEGSDISFAATACTSLASSRSGSATTASVAPAASASIGASRPPWTIMLVSDLPTAMGELWHGLLAEALGRMCWCRRSPQLLISTKRLALLLALRLEIQLTQ